MSEEKKAPPATEVDAYKEFKDEYRMEAYYYGFEPTGVDCIDRILSAVACAGKSFHHTEDWTEETIGGRGRPVDWIQEEARRAADHIRKLEND